MVDEGEVVMVLGEGRKRWKSSSGGADRRVNVWVE